MYNMLSITKLSYLVAVVDLLTDYTHVGSDSCFLVRLRNIAQENTTADILVEDQLWLPLDMVTVD